MLHSYYTSKDSEQGKEKGGYYKMPYSKKRYGSRKKWEKFKRCVKKVKAKSKKVNPYAVCRAAVYKKKKK